MRNTTLVIFALAMLVLVALPQIILAQSTLQSEIAGTYVGRELGRGRGQVVTIILEPNGKASVAIAPVQGAWPSVSTGTWQVITPNNIRLNIAGAAGSGIINFSRDGDQLTALETSFRLSRGFPLQLTKQGSIPGTYTAIRSSQGVLQTFTLRLDPNGTATFTIEQGGTPRTQPIVWTGTWQQAASGDVTVSVSGPGGSQRFTLYRSSNSILTTSSWDHSIWGSLPLTFAKT
ncbi:MAG: hypothetical protein ABFD54_12500 [Armatimonadota bacterium]|nr:hypothetical protein [bacterium]